MRARGNLHDIYRAARKRRDHLVEVRPEPLVGRKIGEHLGARLTVADGHFGEIAGQKPVEVGGIVHETLARHQATQQFDRPRRELCVVALFGDLEQLQLGRQVGVFIHETFA